SGGGAGGEGSLLQTYAVDDPTLLGGAGQTYTVSFPAALGDLDPSQYVIAELDCYNQVAETSKADNVSAALTGIFEQSDGTLMVLGSPASITDDNLVLTQDPA